MDLKRLHEAMVAGDERLLPLLPSVEQYILDAAQPMLRNLRESIGRGYSNCSRGAFSAFLYSAVTHKHTGFFHNEANPTLLEACWPDKDLPCIRSLGDPTHGVGYENCPVTHALEGAISEAYRTGWPTLPVLWVEAGGRMPGHVGESSWVHLGPGDPYPCLRCLGRAAVEKIGVLAWINSDGEHHPTIKLCNVRRHAEYLMARNSLPA